MSRYDLEYRDIINYQNNCVWCRPNCACQQIPCSSRPCICRPCIVRGPTGPAGPQGIQGEIGSAGPVGPQGTQGNTGPTGATGPQGPAGENGLNGQNGATGPTGAIGPQGDTGAIGPQGDTGYIGPQGDTGYIGPQGDIGPAGPQGIQGVTGPAGPQGIQGETGPAGVTGSANGLNAFGGIYNNAEESSALTANVPFVVVMPLALDSKNIDTTGNRITIAEAGTYHIAYNMFPNFNAAATVTLEVRSNGTAIALTSDTFTATTTGYAVSYSGNTIAVLPADAVIDMAVTSTANQTMTFGEGSVEILTVLKLD